MYLINRFALLSIITSTPLLKVSNQHDKVFFRTQGQNTLVHKKKKKKHPDSYILTYTKSLKNIKLH